MSTYPIKKKKKPLMICPKKVNSKHCAEAPGCDHTKIHPFQNNCTDGKCDGKVMSCIKYIPEKRKETGMKLAILEAIDMLKGEQDE